MYLNWYHNFWKIVRELDLIDRFVPRPHFRYYRRGEFPKSTVLTNVGDPATTMENMFSGVYRVSLPSLPVPSVRWTSPSR